MPALVVKPLKINNSNFVSSSITEPDLSVGEVEWTAGTYTLGQRVIKSSTHRVYEVVADPSTTDDPEIGVTKTPKTWVDVGATNKYKMFDNSIGYQSEGDDITIEINSGVIFNSVCGFNITGASSINVTVTDVSQGVVYDKNIVMADESNVNDWFDYYFALIEVTNRFIITDLPIYPNSTLKVQSAGTDMGFGELIFGNTAIIGVAQHGTGWQGLDFSIKERDEFGEFQVVQGRTADLLDYDIKLEKSKFGYVKGLLKSLNGPTVWIGNSNDINDGTAVFGYYRDAQINLTTPSLIDMTVQVEGLV